MFLQYIPEKRTGRVFLTFVESYQDKQTKKIRQRTVRKIGYEDEFADLYPDVRAHFRAVAKQETAARRAAMQEVSISFLPAACIDPSETTRKSIGYMPLSQEYDRLGLQPFLNKNRPKERAGYSLNSIFKLLVFGRVLFPGSKRATHAQREKLFERFDFSLDDVYHSLDDLAKLEERVKLHLHERVRAQVGRDMDCVYYDVTNYYFETEERDDLRLEGISKEHRPNPIVQMGLLMDKQGLPITYKLYPGNTNDCETLMPILKEVRDDYQIGRFIVVADRGLNTSNNIGMAAAGGDGYVVGQSILRANREMKEYVLEQSDYRHYGDSESGFRIKSRIAPRILHLENEAGKPVDVQMEEKQVIFYSEKYALRAKAKRQEALDKALRILSGAKALHKSKGARKYIKGLRYDKKTGEIVKTGTIMSLDEELIREEAKYDGYYAVVSSELDKSDTEIMGIYRGLWRIEDTFRVTKSDLETRPTYVSRNGHIHAHFLTCFTALLLLRLVQLRTNYEHSTGALVDAMRKMNGTCFGDNYYIFDHRSQAGDAIGKAYNMPVERKYLTKKEIQSMRKQPPAQQD